MSKDEWDTIEDTDKSMKDAWYTVPTGMPKDTCQVEMMLNSQKKKHQAGNMEKLEQQEQLNFCDWDHVQAAIIQTIKKVSHYIIILLF